MEKIVVARKHRAKGVSDGSCAITRRLRARGVRRLETGYFQPGTCAATGSAPIRPPAALVDLDHDGIRF